MFQTKCSAKLDAVANVCLAVRPIQHKVRQE